MKTYIIFFAFILCIFCGCEAQDGAPSDEMPPPAPDQGPTQDLCEGACEVDSARCVDDQALDRCVAAPNGCGVWVRQGCAAGQLCEQGLCRCEGSVELCGDGVDNDCDGAVDEGFEAVAEPCSAGVGACEVVGQLRCDETLGALRCDAVALSGAEERCDGVDNDCDGVVDQGFDLETDPQHCGACGVRCGAQEQCMQGECRARFVRIEPGQFQMGSPPDEYGRPPTNKENLATVTLTHPFLMQTTEVTQAQWRRVFKTDPSSFKGCGDDCPADSLNVYETILYLNALSRREGLEECYKDVDCQNMEYFGQGCLELTSNIYCFNTLVIPEMSCTIDLVKTYDCNGYRLPTDAEWEYAARAGTSSPLSNGLSLTVIEPKLADPGAAQICWHRPISAVDYEVSPAQQNYCLNDSDGMAVNSPNCGPRPVALKQPNAWGLYDMAGNMSERVWGELPRQVGDVLVDPVVDAPGWQLGARGGSWATSAPLCRSAAYSIKGEPERRALIVSFRPVRTLF